jgi:hypothetical protein
MDMCGIKFFVYLAVVVLLSFACVAHLYGLLVVHLNWCEMLQWFCMLQFFFLLLFCLDTKRQP